MPGAFTTARAAALAAALLAAGPAGCEPKEIVDPRSADVDFSDPKSVVASIFYAAATGETAHLAGLCDPAGENNADTERICAMTPGSPAWASFRENFARARLNGEPRISGNHASLHFLFGPEGRDRETMELVQRDGRWYLLAF